MDNIIKVYTIPANGFFYLKNACFGFIEEWSSVSSALAQCLLYPFFVWMFAKLWVGLSETHNTFSFSELLIYVGLTEIIFLTSLRGSLVDAAVADFSITLTKPRLWLLYVGSLIFGRQFGRRLILLFIFTLLFPFISGNQHLVFVSSLRFLIMLPILCIVETLYSLLIACMQISFTEVKYFRLAVTKVFMIFGGVFTPLSDIHYTWKSILINTPIADLIFQPCYYCLKGDFYQLQSSQWLIRIIIQIIVCFAIVQIAYMLARRHYQCYGG